ncbi:cysteine proteinase inhibitor-like [Wolffia australiana]
MTTKLGGVGPALSGAENSLEIDQLGRFAVEEFNKHENGLLEFSRVVTARKQVVSGIMHHLSIEVKEGSEKKLYDAKILVQEWLNLKKLHEFKPSAA